MKKPVTLCPNSLFMKGGLVDDATEGASRRLKVHGATRPARAIDVRVASNRIVSSIKPIHLDRSIDCKKSSCT